MQEIALSIATTLLLFGANGHRVAIRHIGCDGVAMVIAQGSAGHLERFVTLISHNQLLRGKKIQCRPGSRESRSCPEYASQHQEDIVRNFFGRKDGVKYKKAPRKALFYVHFGGEGGIRTRGRGLPYTRFPGVFIIDILLFIFLYLTP